MNEVKIELTIVGPVTRQVSLTNSKYDIDFIGKNGVVEVQVLVSSTIAGWLEDYKERKRKVVVYGSLGMAVNDLVIKAEKIKKCS